MLSRRRFLVGAVAGSTVAGAAGPSRPNVVIFLADDLGSGDLGYRGATDIQTPNVDRLAKEGVQFTNAYRTGRCAARRAQPC